MGNAIDRICLLVTLTFKSLDIAVLSIKSAKISYFAPEMQHVNPSFYIQAPEINFETAQLFVEAGPMGISLVVLEADTCFKALVNYPFTIGSNEHEKLEKLKTIIKSDILFQKKYTKTHLFWSFAESILVPAELMYTEGNSKMLNLVFGDASQGIIRSDFLYKHNLHHVYRIPESVVDLFSTYLPTATQTHLFTTLANRHLPEGNHLFVIFYSNSLTLMLCKDGKLQVVQNFDYTNPDECAFYLLNVCKGFDVKPDTVSLQLNGMIDEKSGLYAAIYKYFLIVEFDKLPEEYTYDKAITDYPTHFFSHLFALASCV